MSDPKPTVLVIGDVMLDRAVCGEMTRVSPEAAAPVVAQDDFTESVGGAGNVAHNIVTLGGHAKLLGVVGDDAAGRRVGELLNEAGVVSCLPQGPDGTRTSVKTRIMAGGQYLCRADDETLPLSNDKAVIAGLNYGLAEGTAVRLVCVADYAKGVMTDAVWSALRQRCQELAIPIFVDCRPDCVEQYENVDLLKPNSNEARDMVDRYNVVHPGVFAGEPESILQELRRAGNFGSVLMTQGSDGCMYFNPWDNQIHSFQSSPQQIYDVCGAGDTVMAAMAVGYLEGKSFDTCVQFAMYAAGMVVRHRGVVPAHRDAVDEFRYEATGWAAKCMDRDDALAFVRRRRRRRQSIVLANGCFDGLHAGHIELLRAAVRQGDCLVVACNDDTSLRELKGDNRPLVGESYRLSHLALLDVVDTVFLFDGDVESLVRQLKPDVLVKGQDAAAEPIPGADYVASHGGKLSLTPIIFNLSSSRLGDDNAKNSTKKS